MKMKAKILASLLAALALSGCNEPGYPEHLQVSKVDHEGLQGVLVTPKTEAPLTTVIVLGGSDGGVQGAVATAQVLADQGLAALAVGYFGMPRLPAQLSEIPLEYFSAAVDYIDASPQLQRNQCQQIGVIGSSRGAELALLLGSHNSDFAPVVGIAPSSHTWGAIGDSSKAAWTYAGRPLPYLQRHSQPDYEVDRFIGRPYFVEDLQHSDAAQAEIDATSITGEVVLIAGEDDQLWPSAEMAETLQQQFTDANEQSRITVLTYAGAGHVIAPGTPVNLSEVELPGGQTLVLGGNEKANRAAQEHALPHIVKTLKEPVCRAQPQAHGFDPEQLSALSDFVATTGTSSMVLMSDRKIVFEYGDIHEKHTIHSIRKAMLNSLYGIYVERGVIDLDAQLDELGIDDLSPLSEIEKTATVRQLLQSRSGIYHPAAATSAGMLAQLPARHSQSPGNSYVYNNWDFNVAGAIFEQLSGESIYTAFAREIAEPLGMRSFTGSYTTITDDTDISKLEVDGFYQYERDKSKFPAYHFRMSAYDMALYGQLYENNGVWDGQRILSEEWIAQSTTSYSVTNRYMDFGYGLLWNVINANEERPTKAFFHTGVGIHMLGVYPASDFVFVHRVATEEDYEFNQQNLYKVIGKVFAAKNKV